MHCCGVPIDELGVGHVGEVGQKICPWDAPVDEGLLDLARQEKEVSPFGVSAIVKALIQIAKVWSSHVVGQRKCGTIHGRVVGQE
jgi:hypothetical protein